MNPNEDDETKAFYSLATRYLSGEASSQEREQLVGQLNVPRWKKAFEELRSGWDAIKTEPVETQFDAEAAAQRLTKIIAEEESPIPFSTPKAYCRSSTKKRWGWSFGRKATLLAASLAVVVAGVAVWLKSGKIKTSDSIAWAQRANPAGERSVVTLGDGTKITLNAGGILSYPETFGSQGPRFVRLTGEAFFDVAHDAARPFIVETSTLRIKVLGTQFNVRAYTDGLKAQVSVVQGRVQVTRIGDSPDGKEGDPIILTPGLQYSYVPTTQVGQVRTASTEAMVGWMNGIIVWDREPVAWAMRALERRFGIPIEIDDPQLTNETLTGRFETESVEEIFRTLQLTGVIHYRIVRTNDKIDRIILSSGRPSDAKPSGGP